MAIALDGFMNKTKIAITLDLRTVKTCRSGEADRLGQMKISQFNCDKAMCGFAVLLYGKACKSL